MNFKRKLFLIITPCFFLLQLCKESPEVVKISGKSMGTTWNVVLYGRPPGSASEIHKNIQKILDDFELIFSTWKSDSELSRFNDLKSKNPYTVSSKLMHVFKESEKMHRLTFGAFDPGLLPLIELWGFGKIHHENIPDRDLIAKTIIYSSIKKISQNGNALLKSHPDAGLNFSGNAKGYAVDEIHNYLNSLNIRSHMIEIGGEIVTGDPPPGRESWKIGVENPEYGGSKSLIRVLKVSRLAIATSGDYRNYFIKEKKKYSHILDPRTGYPARSEVVGATVVGVDCITADALATAMIVLGEKKGIEVIEAMQGYEALLIIPDGEGKGFRIILSKGMNKYIDSDQAVSTVSHLISDY